MCTFEGTVDKDLFIQILDKTLVQYLYNFETHRFMQDNDPKHMSHFVADFLGAVSIVHGTPPPPLPRVAGL